MRIRGHDGPFNQRLSRPRLMSIVLTFGVSLAVLSATPLLATDTSNPGMSDVERAANAIERQFEQMGVPQAAYAVISG